MDLHALEWYSPWRGRSASTSPSAKGRSIVLQEQDQPGVRIVEREPDNRWIQVTDLQEQPLLDLRPVDALDLAVRLVNAAADMVSGEPRLAVAVVPVSSEEM